MNNEIKPLTVQIVCGSISTMSVVLMVKLRHFFSILLTIALNMDPSYPGIGIFLVASTLLIIFFFAIGPASVPWMITPELFLQGPRPAAIAVATLVNWMGKMLVGFTFPSMVIGFGSLVKLY